MLAFFILTGFFQLQILYQRYLFALPDKMTRITGNITVEKHTFLNLMSLIISVYCLDSDLIFYKDKKLNITF